MALEKGFNIFLADVLGILNIISDILMNLNQSWDPQEQPLRVNSLPSLRTSVRALVCAALQGRGCVFPHPLYPGFVCCHGGGTQ